MENNAYYEYIKSPEWHSLKIDIIQARGCKCERCNKKKHPAKLQLHHLTYERLFNEESQDLMLVCRRCHMKEHGLIKKPVKKVKRKKGLSKRDSKLQERYNKLKI